MPTCIIRDATHYDCDEFEDKADSEDSEVPGGEFVHEADDEGAESDAEAEASGSPTPPSAEEDAQGYHWRQDAIGRWYKYDHYGNRVFATPLHGSLRPPSIPLKE